MEDTLPIIDRISDLPWHILDNILGRLWVADAARTSILSRQWRYKWVNLSKLVISDTLDKFDDSLDPLHLTDSIYRVLLQHKGQIHTFKICKFKYLAASDISNWISFLSRNGVKELTLYCMQPFELPSCLFSCQQLTHLQIYVPFLGCGDVCEGLRNLVSLHISAGHVVESFALLIRNCPVLERLMLDGILNRRNFTLYAPKLRYSHLDGRLGLVLLENCPALEDITFVNPRQDSGPQFHIPESFIVFEELANLSNLKRLVFVDCLWNLQLEDVSKIQSTACKSLKVLELRPILFHKTNEIQVALAILTLFSNLQELYISNDDHSIIFEDRRTRFEDKECFEFLAAQSKSSCCFNHLRFVKMQIAPPIVGPHSLQSVCHVGFCYMHPELEFIKFVLARSPALEKMTIVTDDHFRPQQDIHFMRELFLFERASERATIVFHSLHDRDWEPYVGDDGIWNI